jgi:hypothetical protein
MARNLAHKHAKERPTDDADSADDRKALLNRREVLQMGVAASAVAYGVGRLSFGGLANTDGSTTYMTDFSDYNE